MIHLLFFSGYHQKYATHLRQACKDRDPAMKSSTLHLIWHREWRRLWDKRVEERGRMRAAAKYTCVAACGTEFFQSNWEDSTSLTECSGAAGHTALSEQELETIRDSVGWKHVGSRGNGIKFKLSRELILTARSGLWFGLYTQG